MSDSVAQDQIKSYVDRILRLKEEAKAINADIRDIYAEAKSSGFDKTVLGKLVNYVEKRATDAAALAEGESLFDLYLEAYDSAAPSRTHARESAPAWKPPPLPEHDAETGEITEPQSPSAAQTVPAIDPVGASDAEPDSVESSAPVLMQEPVDEAEGQGRDGEHGRGEGSQPRLPSDPVENKSDGPTVIAAAPLPEVPADFITDLTPDQLAARMLRTLRVRPLCQRSYSCGRMADQSECAQCLKAAQEMVA